MATVLAGTAAGPNLYQLSVANTALLAAVPANPARAGLTIQNNSANIVTFTFGATVPVSQATGVQIPANTSINIPASGMGTLGNLGAQVNMIANVAGPSNVTVLEFF
jgi:hypothetical protein